MSVIVSAAGLGLFGSSASGGWVIESETLTPPVGVALKEGKSGEVVAGKAEPGEVKKFTMWLEGGKARVDSGKVSVIFDGETREQYVMLHEKGEYMMMTEEDVKEGREVARILKGVETQPGEKVKAVATGKTETINGFKVEGYEVVLPDQKMTFWVTQEGAETKGLREAMLEAYSRVLANTDNTVDMKSLPGIPIKSVIELNPKKTKLKNGMVVATPGKKTTHTVTSIKMEKVEGERFKVPTGYERKELPKREAVAGNGEGVEKAAAPFGKKAVPVK